MADRRERRIKQRQERTETIQQQRAQYRRRERNKRIINYSVAGLVLLALAYGIYVYVGADRPGEHDELARCITQSGATMYGTDWCPHCQEQKRLFGNSFRHINYINCDLNRAACDLAGVEGYPTWVFGDGGRLSGTQQIDVLAERASCVV